VNGIVPKLLFAVLLVFLAGFGSGTIAARRAESARRSTYLEDLASRYDLAPDQVEKVKNLLAREREAIDAILARVETEVRDDIAKARGATQARILADVLTTSQRAAFERDAGPTK